ncbi:hypothetical protein P3X46_016861 [Hevea brasiliensis]|uniref:Uncharacterized protein n=1 Tax=Hevea brasiliensis TaxID=3981 RepID=A0ABQ9M4B6_HEVBR|nr:hypothetical protein P3X46_016861 [Hevea brasiliensis]
MAGSQTKAIALILLLIFMDLSTGQVMGVAQGMSYANPQGDEAITIHMKKMRKLIEIDATLDYEPGKHNSKHEPPKT